MVLAHGRALLATDNTTGVISADFREPEKVLGDPGLLELSDFSRPIGMMMCGILHHIRDDENPKKLVAAYSDRLPPAVTCSSPSSARQAAQAAPH